MNHPEDLRAVHVREHPLPGPGRLFDLTLADGHVLSVAATMGTELRELSIRSTGADEPVATFHCTGAESATLAALLTGIRFVVDGTDDLQPEDAAALRVVTLPAGAPAVGLRLHDLAVPEPDLAHVIAVIRDDTPDLLETDPSRPCQPGDRLVLVARPPAMSKLVRSLLG